MRILFLRLVIALALFEPFAAVAHDGESHGKGSPLHGTVVASEATKMIVRTEAGTAVSVAFEPDTSFERGEPKAKSSAAELRLEDHVMVTGTKLSASEMVARSVHSFPKPRE